MLFSFFSIDDYQTQHWVYGTADKPVIYGNAGVKEENPFLVAHPEDQDDYFAALKTGMQLIAGSDGLWKYPLLGAFAIHWFNVVKGNNRILDAIDKERRYIVSWRWTF